MRARWHAGAPIDDGLPSELRAAADLCAKAVPELMLTEEGFEAIGAMLGRPGGEVLLSWCSASAWRRDVWIAPILTLAAAQPALAARVPAAAADRIVSGPLRDALARAPLLGDGSALSLPANAEARARMEILIWEAGASALEVPELGPWMFGSTATFDEMVHNPGTARCAGACSRRAASRSASAACRRAPDQEIVGRTLQVLQPLLLHPEPLVWIHAARALGRLTGPLDQLEGMLLDWVHGDSRRCCASAPSPPSPRLPAERLRFLASQLVAIITSPDEDAWVLAAVAAATPYLFFERRDLWNRLARRVLAGDGGAITARALARGLATLWRRGVREPEVETPLRALRELARHAPTGSFDDLRRWIEVTAVTDVIDGAERDPLDLELGLDNLVRVAAQYDDEEADARAVRFAATLAGYLPGGAPHRARDGPAAPARRRHQRARGLGARARAAPVGAARWRRIPPASPSRSRTSTETWKIVAHAPAEILDLVKQRRQTRGRRAAGGSAARGARGPARRLRARRLRRGAARPRPRPDRARHLPVAAQDRGPRRRLARAAGAACRPRLSSCSGGSSTPRAAPRSARSTTYSGSARSRPGGRS